MESYIILPSSIFFYLLYCFVVDTILSRTQIGIVQFGSIHAKNSQAPFYYLNPSHYHYHHHSFLYYRPDTTKI